MLPESFNIVLPLLCVFTPLFFGLFLLLFPNVKGRSVWATMGFVVPFLLSLHLGILYVKDGLGADRFLSHHDLGLGSFGIYLSMGMNAFSLPMVLLAVIVGLCAGLYALAQSVPRKGLYLGLLLVMHSGLIGMFYSMNIFFFYFFHEMALIVTFVMAGIWGNQWRRSVAMEMTLYLTFGAMIALAGLIFLYARFPGYAFDWSMLHNILLKSFIGETDKTIIFGLLLFGLGTLVSLFPLHSWAAKAYANLPCANAMLHAGVLKKFGLYGLIQLTFPLLQEGLLAWRPWLIAMALCNVLIIGVITIGQRHLRYMIAYGSVMHMGYAFLGIAAMSVTGVGGALMFMFGHGLCVALLLLLSQSITQRLGTDQFSEMGGLGPQTPVLAGLFTAAMFASIGLPGFVGFWGELSIFIALWELSPYLCAAALLGIVISAVYGLRAVAKLFMGPQRHAYSGPDLSLGEKLPAFLLLAALLITGIWPNTIFYSLERSLTESGLGKAQPAQSQLARAKASPSMASFAP